MPTPPMREADNIMRRPVLDERLHSTANDAGCDVDLLLKSVKRGQHAEYR
jgi:hypothetical protein